MAKRGPGRRVIVDAHAVRLAVLVDNGSLRDEMACQPTQLLRLALVALATPSACSRGAPASATDGGVGGSRGSAPSAAPRGVGAPSSREAAMKATSTPRIIRGVDSGWANVAGTRQVHRPAVRACPTDVPRPGNACAMGPWDKCASDADCPGRNAYCGGARTVPATACRCETGCVQDSDCKAGHVCLCGDRLMNEPAIGYCRPASCDSDAACGGDGVCLGTRPDAIVGSDELTVTFACVTARDDCLTDDDCADRGDTKLCVLADGRRTCRKTAGFAGRPLFLAGGERIATLRAGAWA